jgi:Transposase DDE domain
MSDSAPIPLAQGDGQRVGAGQLRRMVAYGRKVFDLGGGLGRVVDSRRAPRTSAELVAATVFYTGLLRIRSFNALEPRLGEKPFLRLVGAAAEKERLCSVDTVGRSLSRMDLDSVRAVSLAMLAQAERNKVFREGWHGALRYMAIDGWEAFSSCHRHCAECLDRRVRVKGRGEELEEVIQFYHRYAVAFLIDERFDLFLDIEPLLPKDLRPLTAKGGTGQTQRLVKATEDEGELTAATRLVKRVKQTFGWIDVVVADALYANGPFLTTLDRLGLGAVIIARKENEEPLREALQLWAGQAPHKIVEDEKAREKIALWDCHDLETLTSYKGKVRCVRAQVTRLDQPAKPPSTWCMLVAGKATRLAPEKVLSVARARWHIENTGFHQWTTRWRFDHVFLHHPIATPALFWLFLAAFNLLTLFQYLQLRSYGRDCGKDVTRTLSRLVDQMLDELARWNSSAWDTS